MLAGSTTRCGNLAKDAESQRMEIPAEYMFKDVPDHLDDEEDPVDVTLAAMDKHGMEIGLVGLGTQPQPGSLQRYPERFVGGLEIDPNDIGGAVRRIREAHAEHGIVAVTTFPAGCNPQVPVSDRRYYPIYQTCVDLDIPIIVNAGIAGPRVPSDCQNVMHFDQVCYDFPDLRIVMRHGAEPWEDLAVKLMLKWPGLFYMTSAFAPKYYPKAIVDYANTRGAEKIMYAGYYPMGLSLDRIFSETAERSVPGPCLALCSCVRTPCGCSSWESAVTSNRRIPYAGSVHDEREIAAVCRGTRGGPQALRIGKNVREFERRIADLFGKRRGVMCNSGSSALYLAVELLELAPGDEVITSAVTFSTDIAPLVRAGLAPAFVDVEPDTFNVDVAGIAEMIGPRTKAILVPEPHRQRTGLGRHPSHSRRARPGGH